MGRSLDSKPCGRSGIYRRLFSNHALARIQKFHFRSGSFYYGAVVVAVALAIKSRVGSLGAGFGFVASDERTICFFDEVWSGCISGFCRRGYFPAKFSIQSPFVDCRLPVLDSANLASDSANHLSVGGLNYLAEGFTYSLDLPFAAQRSSCYLMRN